MKNSVYEERDFCITEKTISSYTKVIYITIYLLFLLGIPMGRKKGLTARLSLFFIPLKGQKGDENQNILSFILYKMYY